MQHKHRKVTGQLKAVETSIKVVTSGAFNTLIVEWCNVAFMFLVLVFLFSFNLSVSTQNHQL